jgi:hypothetical protein
MLPQLHGEQNSEKTIFYKKRKEKKKQIGQSLRH